MDGQHQSTDHFSNLNTKLRLVCILEADYSDYPTTSKIEQHEEINYTFFPHDAGDILKEFDPSKHALYHIMYDKLLY
jgi:hypothetical protein